MSPRFRTDIDGLRGIAIVIVVLFHAHIPGFGGGFVGVDVFFVISGFLITRNLLGEVDQSRSVSLRTFWAKRIRRLVPALTLMLVVTFGFGLLILSPLEWPAMAKDGAASATYVSNIVFARNSSNYFGGAESIFQHTWSLSVEEQFYLVWPILVIGAAWVGLRTKVGFRRMLVAGLVVMSLGSFAINLVLSRSGSPWAFYSLPTRMWEFGLAGLLAVADGWRPIARRPIAEASVVAGVGLIVFATLTFDGRLAYPGTAALVPVLGTALIIRAGSTTTPSTARTVLAARPCQAVGRVSYSWYLWHWPAILLTAAAMNDDSPAVRSLGALIGLGIAVVAFRLVENPIRLSPTLRASLARTYGYGVAVTVVAVLLAGGVWVSGNRVVEQDLYQDLLIAQRWDLDAQGRPRGCTKVIDPGVGASCVVGAEDADTTVVVVGDSHLAQWMPAFDAAATRLGVRVVVRTYGNCPAVAAPVALRFGPIRPSRGCQRYRAGTARLLADREPDAVVIANSSYLGRILDADGAVPSQEEQLEIWRQAYAAYLSGLTDDGIAAGMILDNPAPPFDPITCIGRTGTAASCGFDRDEGLEAVGLMNAAQEGAARDLDTPTLDVTDDICGPERCSVLIDGEYVYRDAGHLTDAYVLAQTDDVAALLERVLAPTKSR